MYIEKYKDLWRVVSPLSLLVLFVVTAPILSYPITTTATYRTIYIYIYNILSYLLFFFLSYSKSLSFLYPLFFFFMSDKI